MKYIFLFVDRKLCYFKKIRTDKSMLKSILNRYKRVFWDGNKTRFLRIDLLNYFCKKVTAFLIE